MYPQTYYEEGDLIDLGHRAYLDIPSEDYSETTFLKSMPDEHATVNQVTFWMGTGYKSKYAVSDPLWLQYADFDGCSINKLSLNEMLDHMVRWGLEIRAAKWLAERIVFARGVSTPLILQR
jgi:hypothetical protein